MLSQNWTFTHKKNKQKLSKCEIKNGHQTYTKRKQAINGYLRVFSTWMITECKHPSSQTF